VLANYLQDGGYTIVTEGLFSWDTHGPHGCMQDILELCEANNYKTYPVLLYADYKTLWERNQNREYSVPKDEFDELYEYVMSKKSENEMKIDVGDNTVSESVEKLRQYIS
jgi:predicted kinase